MLRTLKTFFEERLGGVARGEVDEDTLPLAVAALLIEISKADQEVDEREREAIGAAAAQLCGVPPEALADLLSVADTAQEDAVSLYDFTSVINEHLDQAQRYRLLVMLWQVAYADGRVDHYEEYYVRKIADLLHLSQRDFIRAKLEAAPAV